MVLSLLRLQVFDLLAYVPQLDLAIVAARDYLFAVLGGADAHHSSCNALGVQCWVRVIDHPVQLAALG